MTDIMGPEALAAYQTEMIDFVVGTPKCALWVDMGLGKTVATLTALGHAMDFADCRRALIIAPLLVAKTTWPDEIAKWAHTRGLTYSIVCGTAKERAAALLKPADLYFINKENTVWLIEHLENDWPFDTLVIDEASAFRNPAAKRFKALKRVAHRSARVVELTGTPSPKDLLALWAQIFLLDGGERLGKTMTAYKQQYFTPDYMGYSWDLKPGAREAIMDKISDLVLVLKSEDHIKLPDIEHIPVLVDLPTKARQQYAELEREFILRLESADTIVAMNAAVLTGKLRQAANGALYTDETGSYETIHDAKIDALESIITRHKNEPVLVAYNFQSDLKRIRERFPQSELITSGQDAQSRWNAGQIPILPVHPASAGHGLNIQFGGRIIVWFGDTWDLELYLQLNARLARRGQPADRVLIYHIRAQNTVDQVIELTLEKREISQTEIFNYLKTTIKGRKIAA